MAESEIRAPDWWVICLCADWCGVCRQWQPLFEQQAREHPHMRFAWIDVEDEAEAMGEVDIDTFPTLLIARGSEARFFGPINPAAQQLQRLLAALQAQTEPASVPAQGGELLRRLKERALPNTRL